MEDVIQKNVLEVLEEVTGLLQEDLQENFDLNLREEGLLDSVSIAAFIMYLEQRLKKKIDMGKLEGNDFDTINSIVAGINRVLKH